MLRKSLMHPLLTRYGFRSRLDLSITRAASLLSSSAPKWSTLLSKPQSRLEKLTAALKSPKSFRKFLRKNRGFLNGYLAYTALFALLYYFYQREVHRQERTETINRLAEDMANSRLASVELCRRDMATGAYIYQARAYATDGSSYLVNVQNPTELIERLKSARVPHSMVKMHDNLFYYTNQFTMGLSKVLIGLLIVSMIYMQRQQRVMTKRNVFSRSDFTMLTPGSIRKRFADVAGCDEAKVEIREYVDFLKNTSKYAGMGAKLPRGAILVGPPGTGKTLLAKACAAEAGVPFFYISGSEFVEGYVGVGARKVKTLFEEAREFAPSIIFIDELDAVGQKRGNQVAEKDNTLNQLLVEMDGFGTDRGVIVFGATNIPDSLDDALKRPGRFDRTIELTLPDKAARAQILKVHLAAVRCSEPYADELANVTPGFSGADLENLANEAAIVAAREGADSVTRAHFDAALERIVGGIATHAVLPIEIKKRVAVHEAGKAVVSWFTRSAGPILKLSLTPRSKRQAGYAQYLDTDKSLQTREALIDKLAGIIAGKMAEEMLMGEASTASAAELKRAYQICHRMVTKLGMSEEVGLLSLKDDTYKIYGDYTNSLIDSEVQKVIASAEQQARALLEERTGLVRALADKLVEKETLQHRDIVEVLGERPFEESESYKQYKDHIGAPQPTA